jgi:hypothetical protein
MLMILVLTSITNFGVNTQQLKHLLHFIHTIFSKNEQELKVEVNAQIVSFYF